MPKVLSAETYGRTWPCAVLYFRWNRYTLLENLIDSVAEMSILVPTHTPVPVVSSEWRHCNKPQLKKRISAAAMNSLATSEWEFRTRDCIQNQIMEGWQACSLMTRRPPTAKPFLAKSYPWEAFTPTKLDPASQYSHYRYLINERKGQKIYILVTVFEHSQMLGSCFSKRVGVPYSKRSSAAQSSV